MSTTNFASIAVFISATVWGLYWVPLRYFETQGVDGAWTVALLNMPPLVILVPLMLWYWRTHRPHLVQVVAIGFMTGTGLALYASGLVLSSVVRATMLFYLTPVWATLIGLVWLEEKVNWQRWLAILVGLVGLFLLLSGGSDDSRPLNIGDLFAVLSGIFWSAGAALIKRYPDAPLPGMTLFQFAFTSLVAVLCSAIAAPLDLPEIGPVLASLPVAAFASIGLILPTVWIIFWAQKILFPGRAGLLMMSEVLVAVISASIFLPEEVMSTVEWIGGGLIICACLIEVLSTPRET
ncbi:DMT family transporter [Rhodobacteraceae bacterium NNCM2]|nr:DMT family transporter [Coraliihabitans acroporae]